MLPLEFEFKVEPLNSVIISTLLILSTFWSSAFCCQQLGVRSSTVLFLPSISMVHSNAVTPGEYEEGSIHGRPRSADVFLGLAVTQFNLSVINIYERLG